jgi:hypothetical protein
LIAVTPTIPGADAVSRFFGRWLSFHDAEILTLHIDRESKRSFLRIRAFTTTDQTDAAGHFVRDRDALVRFDFSGIRAMRIEGEAADAQNVVQSLTIEQVDDGYRLELAPCYGLAGVLEVATLSIHIESTFDHAAETPKSPDAT